MDSETLNFAKSDLLAELGQPGSALIKNKSPQCESLSLGL
jgi:hypothetical protein